MALIELSALQTPQTSDEMLASLLELAASLGFNTTSWQVGSAARTLLQIVASVLAELTKITAEISKQGFNETASSESLTELSRQHFDNTKAVATSTIGDATLTAGAGVGPYVLAIGDVTIEHESNGKRYQNVTGGTLSASSTLELSWQAEAPGADYNLGNDTITKLVTSLAGVTVNNPADPTSGTWITTTGTDAEADATLRTRNAVKWPTLSYAMPGRGYESMVMEADSTITRVFVDDANPGGPGTVYVYVATASGAVGAGVLATLQAYVDARKPSTATVSVLSASVLSQGVTASIYHDGTVATATLQTNIEAAIAAYWNGLPIGGIQRQGSGWAFREALNGAILGVAGVVDIGTTVPTDDISLTSEQIVSLSAATLSFTAA
ncbi:MAG: baseplate J/gp47 family protein [Mycobacterium sp.]